MNKELLALRDGGAGASIETDVPFHGHTFGKDHET